MSRVITTETTAVWSNSDDAETGLLRHPLTDWMPASGVRYVRRALELGAKSGTLGVVVVLEWSHDGETVDGNTMIGSTPYGTADSTDYDATWVDVSDHQRQFFRIIAMTLNAPTTGDDVNLGFVTVRLETKAA